MLGGKFSLEMQAMQICLNEMQVSLLVLVKGNASSKWKYAQ